MFASCPENSYNAAFFWWQVSYMGAFFAVAFFFHFIAKYLGLNKKFLVAIVYILALTFLFFNWYDRSRYFLGDIYFVFDQFYWIDAIKYKNPLFLIFYFSFYWVVLGYAFFLLLKALRNSVGDIHNKLRYFTIAVGFGWLGTNPLFLPAFHIKVYPYSNFLVATYPLFVAYAIIRHQVMEIEIVVKKTLVFGALFLLVLGMFVGVTLITQEFLIGGRIWGLVISAAIIILTVRPLEDILVKITDRYLFQKKYDYQQVLKAFIDEVITLLDLKKIIKGTLDLLAGTLHPEKVSILLIDENTGELVVSDDKSQNNILINRKSEIFSYLSKTKKILILESDDGSDISEELKSEMKSLAIYIAVPLYVQDDIIGVMLLGKKKSDEYYTQEDISILTDLARTEAIAVKNAQFYEKSRREIADKSERKGIKNVAIGASHQMYNALANVQTIAELMHEEIAETAPKDLSTSKAQNLVNFLKNELEILLNESKRGRNMLRSILDRAKARDAFKEIDILTISKRAIDRSSQTKTKEMLKEGRPAPIVLNNISADLPHVIGNEHLIEEVFVNLINNAFDAITDRYVHLKPDDGFRGRITLNSEDMGNTIKVRIEDNGIGMKEEIKDKLFAAYFTTKATSQKGFGAGLFSLREWIEQHNGNISFDSEYGKGATFYIELPKTQEGYHGSKTLDS